MENTQIKRIKAYLGEIEQDFKERGERPKLPLDSMPEFSDKIWGLCKGLTVIGGRTSQGKTALSLQIAYDIANQNIPVLYLSLEQTVSDLIERLFCNVYEVDNYNLQKGRFNLTEEIKVKWDDFKRFSSKIPLLITCGIGKTFQEINKLITEHLKPKVIIVDYVQNTSKKYTVSREMLNDYILYFRQLCIERNIAGILVSQINRQAADNKSREPALYNLKETGALEETADRVLLLHWDSFYTYDSKSYNQFKVIVAKNRNGRTGEHMLYYTPQYYKFEENSVVVGKVTDTINKGG